MNKKITLNINGSRFDIDIEVEFAHFLEQQLEKDLNMEGSNSFKTLLQAYIRKNYDLYNQEIEIKRLLEKIK